MNNKKSGTFMRVMKLLFGTYPVLMWTAVFCILFSAAVAAVPDIYIQQIISIIEKWYKTGDWASAYSELLPRIIILIVIYLVAWIVVVIQSQLMAYITQGFLAKMRQKMFDGMQRLPIKFFDTHKHGDIMSHYTNDIDTLRQLVSQSLPSILRAGSVILFVLGVMLYYSLWMTLIILAGVIVMVIVSKKVGGGSAKYFIKQQKSIGRAEGYIQEMMNGQKVVKVFSREKICEEDFEKINDELYKDSSKAHAYANILGPIIANVGNILYVIVAISGGMFLALNVPNISISRLAFDISIVVPFLNMTKQFTGNVNQFSQQINSIAMGIAGAKRIFEIMDAVPEEDEGYVTLVDAALDEKGDLKEAYYHTGMWAWKHPHSDGSVTYTRLCGDVRMEDVDFGYEENKTVLKNISLYAKPGQKVAFVGATGAGKTTITNLINRFYDISTGKIRYDGININKIKKADLRRSLGIVLQDTNLFTGTVMDNIRYGRLDATDEE